ncbi:retrovirus-related pol polyprotein from transposon TNT 1-94 [Tanacetum coccineum]
MKCPQHYLTDMQEVILFYNGLDVPTRQILDSKGAIPSKSVVDAKIAIHEMAEYSQKWHNGTSSGTRRRTQTRLGQFLKEIYDNTFSGSEHEDANEHIENVLEIFDLFHIPKVTQDPIMLRAFLVSLIGAASRWLRNQPSGSITTWEVLKTKFLNKYCPPARTAKKMEEINNFQQEPDEILFRAWERFKELLMKYPQHYLTDMQLNLRI